MKNWLDLDIKPDYLTHSVTTIIKTALTFVADNVIKLLHMSSNKTYIGIGLTGKLWGIKIIKMLILSTPCKAGQPLYGIELQEKDAKKKEWSIKEISLERTYP